MVLIEAMDHGLQGDCCNFGRICFKYKGRASNIKEGLQIKWKKQKRFRKIFTLYKNLTKMSNVRGISSMILIHLRLAHLVVGNKIRSSKSLSFIIPEVWKRSNLASPWHGRALWTYKGKMKRNKETRLKKPKNKKNNTHQFMLFMA